MTDLFQSRLAVHPCFGKSFFLTCDPEVMRNRFKGRISRGNDAPEDHLLLTNPEQFFAMEAELRRLATIYFNNTILDASGLEDEKCSNQLLDRILAEIPTAVAVEIEPDLLWQRGAKMATRYHLGQLRKDGKTPYIAHPMRVSLTLQRIFGVSDPSILTAALLHDLIEDTTADYDDIQEACGDDIARMVATLTKNSCLPEEQREPAFHDQLLAGDWRTKLVKIADVYDNLCDSRESLAKVNVWERAKLALELAGEDPRLARAAQALRELMASFPEEVGLDH